MRSNQHLMQGILQRKAAYLAQRQVRRLKGIGAGLAALLMTMLFVLPGIAGNGEAYAPSGAYGAMILGPETGGYVIVALLAFALGIVVTLIIQKRRGIRDEEAETKRKKP